MSDKPTFGRDAEEFLHSLGNFSENDSESREYGIRIISLNNLGSEKTAVKVAVSNQSGREELEFAIMPEHLDILELQIGEVSEELLSQIEYYSEVAKAYSSACTSFAYTPSSLRALNQKLLQKGFSRGVCDDAISCVKSRGFVNENDIAVRRAQICVGKLWGRSRIIMKLREEGFCDSALCDAEEYLSEIDFAANCAALISKRLGDVPIDTHERDRMYASLSRMGYSVSDIRKAVDIIGRG